MSRRSPTLIVTAVAISIVALFCVAPSLAQEQAVEPEAVGLRWEAISSEAMFPKGHPQAEALETLKLTKPVDGGWLHPVSVMRAKVPGGWFVFVGDTAGGPFFYPDSEHGWDGRSLR